MGLTILQLVRKVSRYLPEQRGVEARNPADIEALIPWACKEIAVSAITGSWRRYLEKTFTLSFTANVAVLTDPLLLLESIGIHSRLTVTGITEPFDWYRDRRTMDLGVIGEIGRYSVQGTDLYVRASTTIAAATPGALRAVFIPVITADGTATTLPDRLIPEFVDMVRDRFMMTNSGGAASAG